LVAIPVPVRPEAAFVACTFCSSTTSLGVFMGVDFGSGGCDPGGGGGVLNECRCSGDGSGVCAGRMDGNLFLSWSGSRDGEVVI